MIGRRSGVILNMSSDAGKVPTPGEAVIGALKAAVIMFTRTGNFGGLRMRPHGLASPSA